MTSWRDARERLIHRRRYSLPSCETTSVLHYILTSSICVMKRLKFLLSHYSIYAVNEHGRCRVIAPFLLNIGNRWLPLVKFKLRPLYPRKDYGTYWIGRCLGPRSGLEVLQKINHLPVLGFEPRTVQPVAKSLHPLCYYGCKRKLDRRNNLVKILAAENRVQQSRAE